MLRSGRIPAWLAVAALLCLGRPVPAQEVVVLGGIDAVRDWLEAERWWGEDQRNREPGVPRAIITGIDQAWRETAPQLTVADKKEIFYRLMLPLIVHANDIVLERRAAVIEMRAVLAANGSLEPAGLETLRRYLATLRVLDEDAAAALPASSPELPALIDALLYKLDVIPAGLVLGQAAYESGYGTSRFAVEGNALFGQWTFGGDGIVPAEQRAALGDHRIAAFDWPFDSVRGYFINLLAHPAYEEFRRLRADLRAQRLPLDSLVLADGLVAYSERGQEYVDTLKSMIRVNGLDVADGARFRDEPMRFLVGAADEEEVIALRRELERMRASGELAAIVESMQLD